MNAARFHLVINHLPIVGVALAAVLLILALLQRAERGALRAAVLVLAISAAGAVAAYVSGEPAEEIAERLPGTSEQALEVHEDRAGVATGLAVLTALAGVAALALVERRRIAPGVPVAVALAGATLTSGAMIWTGASGGEIRHPEARAGVAAAAPVSGQSGEAPSPGGGDRGEREADDD